MNVLCHQLFPTAELPTGFFNRCNILWLPLPWCYTSLCYFSGSTHYFWMSSNYNPSASIFLFFIYKFQEGPYYSAFLLHALYLSSSVLWFCNFCSISLFFLQGNLIRYIKQSSPKDTLKLYKSFLLISCELNLRNINDFSLLQNWQVLFFLCFCM